MTVLEKSIVEKITRICNRIRSMNEKAKREETRS